MKAALEAMAAQAVNVALAVIFVAVWLGLSAYLDAKPTETDALQADALNLADAVADANQAARGTGSEP